MCYRISCWQVGSERDLGAGVLPYWLLAPPIAQTLAVLPPDFLMVAAQSQMTYAACIISFLGGLHWALAMVHQGGMYSPLPWRLHVPPCCICRPTPTPQLPTVQRPMNSALPCKTVACIEWIAVHDQVDPRWGQCTCNGPNLKPYYGYQADALQHGHQATNTHGQALSAGQLQTFRCPSRRRGMCGGSAGSMRDQSWPILSILSRAPLVSCHDSSD